jgi:predicted tellurium resistance membrane protein TerC
MGSRTVLASTRPARLLFHGKLSKLLRCSSGAARDLPSVLAFGLLLSIALMGIGANWLARLLQKQRWIAYAGLAIIFYVAGEMIYRGVLELKPVFGAVGLVSAR